MTVGTTQLAPGNGHNYIINGAFDIWQRFGPGETVRTVNSLKFGADRWQSVQTVDVEQSTDTPSPEFKYSAKVIAPDASTFHGIRTRLESKETSSLAGKTVTLSFWVKLNQDALDNKAYVTGRFLTAGANDDWNTSSIDSWLGARFFANDLNLTADVWHKVTLTREMPAHAVRGIEVAVLPNGNITGTNPGILYVTGVQLEAGSVATPFKRNANSIAGELAACQRYYWRVSSTESFTPFSVGAAVNSTQIRAPFQHPSVMRAAPTFSSSGLFANTAGVALTTSSNFQGVSHSFINFNGTGLVANTANVVRASNDTTAYLEFDSEI